MSPVHRHRAQMRFSDTDQMGHVNHARLLAYLEDARIGLLRASAAASGLDVSGVILAALTINYRRPVWVRDEGIDVEVWVESVGRTSFTLGNRLLQDGEVAADATTVLVRYDYACGAPVPLNDAERTGLEAFSAARS